MVLFHFPVFFFETRHIHVAETRRFHVSKSRHIDECASKLNTSYSRFPLIHIQIPKTMMSARSSCHNDVYILVDQRRIEFLNVTFMCCLLPLLAYFFSSEVNSRVHLCIYDIVLCVLQDWSSYNNLQHCYLIWI